MDINEISCQTEKAVEFIIKQADSKNGSLFVIGCSTSEIAGNSIGKGFSSEIGTAVISSALKVLKEHGILLAVQCCEHLNRALAVEQYTAQRFGYETVMARPISGAGGSAAEAAFRLYEHPVLVESIKADAGMDIGDTFIGMHLKSVAVPLRADFDSIGCAHLTMAKTRPRYIGGPRTVYE